MSGRPQRDTCSSGAWPQRDRCPAVDQPRANQRIRNLDDDGGNVPLRKEVLAVLESLGSELVFFEKRVPEHAQGCCISGKEIGRQTGKDHYSLVGRG